MTDNKTEHEETGGVIAECGMRGAWLAQFRTGLAFPKVRAAVAVFALVVALAAIVGAGQVVAALQDSTATETVFNNSAELAPELIDSVVWNQDADGLPREMDPLTRKAVTVSWLRAWEQLAIVAETGETVGVESYFSNDAKRAVLAAAEGWKDRSISQQGHELQLTFFSEDGQVLALTSRSEVVRGVGETNFSSTEEFEVVMLLEDGNWRVQHMVRRSLTNEPIG